MNREMSKDSELSKSKTSWDICTFFNISKPSSESKDCKKCKTAQGIIESLNRTIVSVEYEGPGEECSSNYYTVRVQILTSKVIIKYTFNEYNNYEEEYKCVSIDTIAYALAHDPTNLLSDKKQTHESVSFAEVKELEEEQRSPFYHYVDDDGFDYSNEKSPTILLLEDIQDTLMKVSFLKEVIPEKNIIPFVLSYVDYDKCFDLENVSKLKIGKKIEY